VLYAQAKYSVLIVFQAMDAGGKDGAIEHIFSGVNPQGCSVASFKAPSHLELAHDYLWRYHIEAPKRGMLGIFNRSHYESVLVERVREIAPKKVWSKRYDQINAFEEMLAAEDTVILKFYLNISKKEQAARLQARLDDPTKNWKFNPGDLEERGRWDDYMEAFQDLMERCSTEHAPWYVIPSNKKWFRNWAISDIIVRTLKELPLKFPDPIEGIEKFKIV
jgi:PPK2 family polyphosphate:nucleotide phosphotransferase